MTDLAFELRLLAVFRQALRERRLTVAEHLLSAIEACAPDSHRDDDALVAEAYIELARFARTGEVRHSRPEWP